MKKNPIFRFPGSWVPYGYLSSLVESAPGSGPQTCPIWVSWWYWIKIRAKINQIIKNGFKLFSRKQGIHALHLWRKSQEALGFTFTKAWTSSLNNTQIWGTGFGTTYVGRQFGGCILYTFLQPCSSSTRFSARPAYIHCEDTPEAAYCQVWLLWFNVKQLNT